jgi:hypothetical protein
VSAVRLVVAVALLAALLAGCGSTTHEKKAATRPAALFGTPPTGLKYRAADAATVNRVKSLLSKSAPGLSGDDVAVRQVLQKGGLGQPIAVGVAVDTHSSSSANSGDALKGFDEAVKQQSGTSPQTTAVAGTPASLARLSGTVVTVAEKNGYVLEAIAADSPTAKRVLTRLVVAARAAKR